MRQGHDEGQSHDHVTAGDVLTTRELRAVGVRPSTLLSVVASLGREAIAARRRVGVGTLAKLDRAIRRAKLRWSGGVPATVAPRTPAQIKAIGEIVELERMHDRALGALLRCQMVGATAVTVTALFKSSLRKIEAAADLVVPDAVEVTT